MAGSSWPTLTAGAIARAADVNAHFAWLEGSIVPMSAGSTTDSVHDIGTTSAYWRTIYTRSIAGTSTAKCVVVGTTAACTTTADSDASFEFAGIKSIILPRLSTTQIGNLTSVDGMIAYNTSTAQLQIRKSGAWVNVGGPVYKNQGTLVTNIANASTVTVLNIASGGGKIHGIFWKSAPSGIMNSLRILLDGNTLYSTVGTVGFTTTANYGWIDGSGFVHASTITAVEFSATVFQTSHYVGTTASLSTATKLVPNPGTFDFASTAAIFASTAVGNTCTMVICYSLIQ